MLADLLARNWGWVLLRGVVALLFGLLTLVFPGVTVTTLVLLFGAYALVDGLFRIVTAIARRRGEEHWVLLLIGGLLGIAAGIVTFTRPGITATFLLYLVAFWAIFMGLSDIVVAIRLRKLITGEWLVILTGVLEVIFGVGLILFPAAGALAIALWIGAYATALGILLIVLAFRLRRWHREREGGALRRAA